MKISKTQLVLLGSLAGLLVAILAALIHSIVVDMLFWLVLIAGPVLTLYFDKESSPYQRVYRIISFIVPYILVYGVAVILISLLNFKSSDTIFKFI